MSEQRAASGRFVAGNRAAVSHGLHARAELDASSLEGLRAELAEILGRMLVDEGDASGLPERRLELLEYRARVHRRIVQIDDALERFGVSDKRGRLRVGWLQQLGTLIAAAQRLDAVLGLKKRPKRVATLAEVLAVDGEPRG